MLNKIICLSVCLPAAFLQRNENTVMVNITVINCAKVKNIRNLN